MPNDSRHQAAAAPPHEGSAAAPDRLIHSSSRVLRWVAGLAIAAAIGILVVVALVLRFQSVEHRDELAAGLVETNDWVADFVTGWVKEQRALLEVVGSQAPMVSWVSALIENEPGSVAYEAAARVLVSTLGPLIDDPSRVIVASPNGQVVYAPGGVSGDIDSALHALIGGEGGSGVSVLPLQAGDTIGDSSLPATARVWAPIDRDGTMIGWLGVEVDVTPLVQLLSSAAASTESREVYFFDVEGRLLTPSRFEDQLRTAGLLDEGESSIGLRLVDPGANLIAGQEAAGGPVGLTVMAASATSGAPGVDVEGYRDYRGVEVVGAWRWIDELGVGIATEVDRDEANAVLKRASWIWSLSAAVLISFVLVLSTVFLVTDRRLRRTGRRLLDLTDNLDDEVRARTAELEVSQAHLQTEVAARTELMAAVSHELRTPLTSVVGFASLLAEQDDQIDPSLRGFVRLLLQESEDMSDLVDDLLTSVQASTGSLRVEIDDVDLAAEAAALVATWDSDERGRIVAELDFMEARGDALRIRQVLRNLITNAMRYGGPSITISTVRDGDDAVLVVSDDGPMLDAEIRDRMFEPYSRSSTSTGLAPSIGMGLTLCRRLSEAMGGSVQVERRDGLNRFVLRLPATLAPALAQGQDAA